MPEDPERVKARAGEVIALSDDVPMFLFVGQHIWQKNLRLIYEACKQLANSGERFLMMMVGDGSVRGELMALVEDAGLSEYFAFPGIVKDRELLSSLYVNARALVFPSLYDTSGLVVREAAAMHCPAIVVANSDAATGIVHRKNGLLCENDIDSLTQQMRYAIQTPEACKRMGRNASHTLARSWECIVDDVFWAYRDVLIDYHKLAVV